MCAVVGAGGHPVAAGHGAVRPHAAQDGVQAGVDAGPGDRVSVDIV